MDLPAEVWIRIVGWVENSRTLANLRLVDRARKMSVECQEPSWRKNRLHLRCVRPFLDPRVLDWAEEHDLTQGFNWERLLIAAARRNSMDALEWMLASEKFDAENRSRYFFHKRKGFLDMLTDALNVACSEGNTDIARWFIERLGVAVTEDAMDLAAENGRYETMLWLHETIEAGCTTDAMDGAAKEGHLEIVKWLHGNRREGCTTRAMDRAAMNGHLETLQWLHENRTEGCTFAAMDFAAAYGHLDVVRWLHENRVEGCTSQAMIFASINDHWDIVLWLRDHRTEGCFEEAVKFRNIRNAGQVAAPSKMDPGDRFGGSD